MNAPSSISNPFVGLRPFEAEESILFFGRQQQIAELLQRLHQTRFLAVVGSSGCGKSSLVRAGLIPVLRAGFLVDDRDLWHVAKMTPGGAPLARLARCILDCAEAPGARPDAAEVEAMAATIRESGALGIVERLSAQACVRDANILLLIDQFEELFRFERPAGPSTSEDAADFVSIVLDLAQQRTVPVYVVITMRSDYLGDCDLFFGLPEALNRSQYLVPRLSREQRREAIEGPIRLYRQQIAPRLTDRLLNETIDTRDDLPVLQHALMRTWERWKREGTGPLDSAHYEAVGTVDRALSQDASAALEGLDERRLLLTKRLFQALTTVDAGNRSVRRPARLRDVAERCGVEPDAVWPIVQRFRSEGRSFLIVSSEDPGTNPLIDISHESLIRQWTLLGRWVEEEVESIRTYKRLAETERLRRSGRSGLYRDQELQAALEWQARECPNATWARDLQEDFEAAMAFLAESKEVRDRALTEAEVARRWRPIRWLIVALVAVQFLTNLGTRALWEGVEASIAEQLSSAPGESAAQDAKPPARRPALPHLPGGPHETEQKVLDPEDLAGTITFALRLSASLGAYLILAGIGKRLYRRFAAPTIRASISGVRTRAQARREWGVNSMRKLISSTPRLIETAAKWLSVVGGIVILSSCTLQAVQGPSIASLLLGLALSALMVGWVFAVARLNGEVKLLRDASGDEPQRQAESGSAP